MKRYRIVFTYSADEDLNSIVDYFLNEIDAPKAAVDFISRLRKYTAELSHLPLRNPLVSDQTLARQGIRKVSVNNYLVFYIVSEELQTVTIIRILHNRRHWSKII